MTTKTKKPKTKPVPSDARLEHISLQMMMLRVDAARLRAAAENLKAAMEHHRNAVRDFESKVVQVMNQTEADEPMVDIKFELLTEFEAVSIGVLAPREEGDE